MIGEPTCHWRQLIENKILTIRFTFSVDGGWGKWSHWVPCSYLKRGSSSDGCLCQQRLCNNPEPAFGGKQCDGVSIQVTNCTGMY